MRLVFEGDVETPVGVVVHVKHYALGGRRVLTCASSQGSEICRTYIPASDVELMAVSSGVVWAAALLALATSGKTPYIGYVREGDEAYVEMRGVAREHCAEAGGVYRDGGCLIRVDVFANMIVDAVALLAESELMLERATTPN